jgi:hypothetical protein
VPAQHIGYRATADDLAVDQHAVTVKNDQIKGERGRVHWGDMHRATHEKMIDM